MCADLKFVKICFIPFQCGHENSRKDNYLDISVDIKPFGSEIPHKDLVCLFIVCFYYFTLNILTCSLYTFSEKRFIISRNQTIFNLENPHHQ